MGIGGFQKWLVSSFPDAVTVVPARAQDGYAHVCFDLNQVCHQAARRATDLQSVAKLIFREIDLTLKVVTPIKSVFFAFDGPAPTAKLLTQRRRRTKEAAKAPKVINKPTRRERTRGVAAGAIRELDEEEKASVGTSGKRRKTARSGASASSSARPSVHAIDRVALTPGVELMHDLAAAVEYYSFVRLQSNPRFARLHVRISGPDVPGEGELKIFDFLTNNVASVSSVVPAYESAVVIGSDADIVLQALATTSMQNLFVFVRNSNQGHQGNLDWSKRTNTIISVWQIACHLHRLFPNDSLTVRLDLIILSICSGNDYVPKLRGATIPRLWKRYNRLRRGVAATEKECVGEVYEEQPKTYETAAASRRRAKKDQARKAKDLAAEGARGPLFANQTLVDPACRTFNWPFLCALVESGYSHVSELSARSLHESRIISQRPVEVESERIAEAVSLERVVDDSGADEILYTGDETGAKDTLTTAGEADGPSGLSGGEARGEDTDFDEYEDDDTAHIETLVAIAGSSSKYFDTVEWLRTLLFTLQMYIDGYCPDFYYAYTKPYAPSTHALATFIKSVDGDPHPVLSPVSISPPLTPLKAALAILPRSAAHFLPLPFQEILKKDNLFAQMFGSDDTVCFSALHRIVDSIPPTAFSAKEQQRLGIGHVIVFSRSLQRGVNGGGPGRESRYVPAPPGVAFPVPPFEPLILRSALVPTRSPPCLPWPSGHIPNMLERPTRQSHGRGPAGSFQRRGNRGAGATGRGGPRARGSSSGGQVDNVSGATWRERQNLPSGGQAKNASGTSSRNRQNLPPGRRGGAGGRVRGGSSASGRGGNSGGQGQRGNAENPSAGR